MITDPVRLRLLKNLATTLQGMSDPDLYHFPVTDPSQVTTDPTVNPITGNAGSGLLFVIEPTTAGQRTFYPASQLKDEFMCNISARASVDASDPLARMAAWEFLAADLEAVLTLDLTRAGDACDTRLEQPQPFMGIGTNIVGIVQPVRMTIYRAYRDGT
jgi:hypothetical protein